jgi:type IV pilus assembly protein PilA
MQPSPQGFSGREFLFLTGVVVIILATLSWSAFQKVRTSSQDKAVLCPVRQLAAAADQYYLENGVTVVAYQQLVGATNYIKSIQTVAHETYPAYYTRGLTITVTGIAGARTITYAP